MAGKKREIQIRPEKPKGLIPGSKSRDLFTFESKVFPEATSRKFNYFFQKRQIQKINFELFGEKNPLCLPITP